MICYSRKFRLKWPWEQDRQMAVFNRSSSLIQVTPQPERFKMTTRVGLSDVADGGWCLSHLPGWGCFIFHYCSSSHSKRVLKRLYASASHSLGFNFTVQYLTVSLKY